METLISENPGPSSSTMEETDYSLQNFEFIAKDDEEMDKESYPLFKVTKN